MAEPDSEHSTEAYRALFALMGAAMLVLVLAFILASFLVVPVPVIAGLVGVWGLGAFLAFAGRKRRPWLPLLVGTVLAVLWLLVLTAGSAVFGWRP
jgi:hypothetical protein